MRQEVGFTVAIPRDDALLPLGPPSLDKLCKRHRVYQGSALVGGEL